MMRIKPQHRPILATVVVLASLYVLASLRYPGFFSWFQFAQLFADNASLGLAAIGMTFVILSGGIDLSVGAVIALASILLAKCIVIWQWPVPAAIAIVLFAGGVFGAGTGAIIRYFKLPPFLVTLAGMFLARGIALVMTETKRLTVERGSTPTFDALVDLKIASFNLPAIVFLAMVFIAVVLAHRTRFGRAVYAIGGNRESALLMGLPVGTVTIKIYALSGLCAAAGGIVHTIGTGAGEAVEAGKLLELDAIAAVVIGGTLLSGGVGFVAGTLLGVLILSIITVVPSYEGNLSSSWTKIAIGGLLLSFILLQRVLHRRGS